MACGEGMKAGDVRPQQYGKDKSRVLGWAVDVLSAPGGGAFEHRPDLPLRGELKRGCVGKKEGGRGGMQSCVHAECS